MFEQKDTQSNETRIIPLTEWPKFHSWPPLGGLRHLVFHGKATGFDQVIRRIGRRVLIDEAAFFAWVASKNNIVDGGSHG